MTVILIFLKNFFGFLFKNWGWIATIAMLLFVFLFFKQCQETKIAQTETAEAIRIAENNLKAIKDSTIVLKVTRDQLAILDANMARLVKTLDSLKQHPKTIIITKPYYVPKEVITSNTLVKDSADSSRYGLRFYSEDSVRTIGAVSWFNIFNTYNKLQVTPDYTKIDNFALNFGLVIDKYEDLTNKMTRLSVVPYYVDSCGTYTKPISSKLLHIQYRGADLLDVPYRDVSEPDPPPKHKYSVRSGFSLSVNLLSYGYTPITPVPAFNWIMPSIGLGYSFVLIRNK